MPSLFAVNSNGKRIKTDILVVGWLRRFSKIMKLLIPDAITQMCFDYWLITICDEWDENYCSEYTTIKNEIAIMSTDDPLYSYDVPAVYGCHSASSGSHEWIIRFKSSINFICICIIADEANVLQLYQKNNDYWFSPGLGGWILNITGNCHQNGRYTKYCDGFKKKGTTIKMRLNMENRTLNYIIDNKDYGIAMTNLSKKSYRFAMFMNRIGQNADEVEFL